MKATQQRKNLFLANCGATALLLAAVVCGASAQTLVHEYSFNGPAGPLYGGSTQTTNVTDLINPGGAWDGTFMTGGLSGAPAAGNFTGSGQLTLQAATQDYVQLPAGILSNYTAVTIDIWATLGSLPANCFLYGFGNTDSGGAGYNYIFCQPSGGRIAMSGVDPGWQGEEGTGGAGDFSGRTVHVTSVYNPPAGIMELYTNGVLVSRNSGINIQMNQISNVLNYIGRSLYNPDSFIDVNLDEFRIWNGALNALQVGGCDVNGPDNPSTNYGSVTSIQLSVPIFQLVQGNHEFVSATGQASGLPYAVDITPLATYTTSDGNILRATNNAIYAIGQGSAKVIASYGSVSSTQTVTVIQPASVLAHRYNFNDANGSSTVADSVGGAAWNGTLPNGGTLTGSQVSLSAASSQFVQLPAGIITNDTAVTLEAWVTFPDALPGNCFFFGFGITDGGGAGGDYIYLQPSAGHIGITGSDPGYQGPEQLASGYGNLSSKTNVHIAAVFNPGAGWIAVYTNGVLVGKNTAVTWQLSQVKDVLNYIGRSLYNGDSYMDVNVDEFRIWNGALTSQEIALSDVAGPNSIPSTVTNGPGAFVSMTLQAPASLQWLQTGKVKALANYQNLTNFDLVGNSIFPPAGLTITSSDTNVLAYNSATAQITGVNPGTATISVTYQGITQSNAITVFRPPIPQLVHEYKFNDAGGSTTVADSIGGTAWNGTLPNGGTFNGTGQLSLDSAASQYVTLPSGILSNYTGLTVEVWVTQVTAPTFAMLYAFGNTDAGGLGENYIFGSLPRDYTSITAADPGYTAEQGVFGGGTFPLNQELHYTAVYNPAAGYIALYTNGVLQGINNTVTDPLSVVSPVEAYIGRSLYNGDPYASLILNEFRIYKDLLSPDEIAATQAIGPNQTLTTSVNVSVSKTGGSLVFTWPAAAAGFTLQSKASLASSAWQNVSGATPHLAGSQWQVMVPAAGGNNFYRLAR